MEITSIVVGAIVQSIIDSFRERRRTTKQSPVLIETNIESHLNEVLTWSERVQFYGMSAAQQTDSSTINLKLEMVPRKFRRKDANPNLKKEDSLLQDREHYLLLGDPGSGKTTTLKRLARKMLLATPVSENDEYQYPIVLRLRDLNREHSLYVKLAETLGLTYTVVQTPVPKGLGKGQERFQILVDGTPIEAVVADVLNASKALLLLDGLDEVSSGKRASLEREIQGLAYRLRQSKVILTSRSGDFVVHFDAFNVIEICPLDIEQITTIASKWLGPSDEFFEHLLRVPYQDLADRPLFLTQLILFFQNYGYLPDQPSTIYKKIASLMLEEWDAERRIVRKSKYGSFNPERKIEFLAALSYHLTYKLKTKVFTTRDLMDAYLTMHQRFNLPGNEAKDVASEIETHTGIIVEAGNFGYEFSHLSLQEYLCAYYLVREPYADHLGDYLREYSAPLAVAVALSSNPSNWFASLFLREQNFSRSTPDSISMFLDRLISEKPFFQPSPYLGLAVLALFFKFGTKADSYIRHHLSDLLEIEGVKKSLAQSLMWFAVDPDNRSQDDEYFLKRRFHIANSYGFVAPEAGYLPKSLITRLVEDSAAPLVVMQTHTGSVVRFQDSGLSQNK